MAKLIYSMCLISLAFLACSVFAGPVSQSNNLGRYNPKYYNNPYSRHYKNRDYYNKRNYYDNFFKSYNPNVVAPQAHIIDAANHPNQDGVYSYTYETENGIHGEEQGVAVKVAAAEPTERVEGSYSYITPEGTRVGVRYTADENGFHPIITYDGVNAERYANLQAPADVVLTKIN